MPDNKNNNELPAVMSEMELIKELKESLLILTTSSDDKRKQYATLFTSLDRVKSDAGVNAFFTDSGFLGITPRKTPEMTGDYEGNLDEKALQQLFTLQDKDVEKSIRKKLRSQVVEPDDRDSQHPEDKYKNEFDPQSVNIMGMTEDSGWEIIFDNSTPAKQKEFLAEVKRLISPRLRKQDQWLVDKIEITGFPGPNLKPLQEHLSEGFNSLMEVIYEAAKNVDMKEMRYSNHVRVSFVSPRLNKVYPKEFRTTGTLISKEEYEAGLLKIGRGEAINSDFVQIPDGQRMVKGLDGQERRERKTISMLKPDIFTKSSKDLPGQFIRRSVTEWLQGLIGKNQSTHVERDRPVRVGVMSPSALIDEKPVDDYEWPCVFDFTIVKPPFLKHMRRNPNMKLMGAADIMVLVPEDNSRNNDMSVYSDPNLKMVLHFLVAAITDPQSMRVPVILDNRTKRFDPILDLLQDAFVQGRLMGESPLIVANTTKELRKTLLDAKAIKQSQPVIHTPEHMGRKIKAEPVPKVPNDGIFTVFIGGGHANNSKSDLEDAHDFGYYCASKNWRIITGAGSIEGSMGATHTGFIQYHLDHLNETKLSKELKETLSAYKVDGKYDAETLIQEKPELIETLADKKFIPRKMFYGYSMEDLLKMESPNGKKPPGITYCEAGNMVRRLDALMASGTKVFLFGGVGSDQEVEEAIDKHLRARERKMHPKPAKEPAFADGTPDDDGKIIIYNRNGHLDKLLEHYHLLGTSAAAKAARKVYNVEIVNNPEKLKEAMDNRAETWLERLDKRRTSTRESSSLSI